ncbi:MAG: ribonuclease HI, partial [Acutalibacteraceae bacterium]|nr:ribonuclease HI [Acutalibacteraceae bacterium]
MLKSVDVFTDGACSGNPGPGGWGVVLRFGEHEKELSGGEKNTTNNRMELTAAIMGLSALKEKCKVRLVTDSKYVADGITKGWAASWQKNGWKKADKKPALNPDLWEILLKLTQKHEMRYH